ncbi:MAG: twin-arginine translocation signal domain-containing protein [Candidatus Woesearchaeota archaeon]
MALDDKISRRGFLKGVIGTGSALALGGSAACSDPVETVRNEIEGRDRSAVGFLEEHKATIEDTARENGLPPAFLASILYAEMANRPSFEDVGDNMKSAIGLEGSYGPGQVQLSTALQIDGLPEKYGGFSEIPGSIKRDYISMLKDPEQNIMFAARYLSFLRERSNRYSSLSAEGFAENPEAMAVIATEYQIGPKESDADEAGFNPYGYGVVKGLSSSSEFSSLYPSGSGTISKCDAFLREHKQEIREEVENRSMPDKFLVLLGGYVAVAAAAFSAVYAIEHMFGRKNGSGHGRKKDRAERALYKGDLKDL